MDGSGLTGVPGNGLDGIALIDTNGTIVSNHVENIEQKAAMGDASVHGIEVKSTRGPVSALVAENSTDHYAGHVAVDLMAAGPGSLSASVVENAITGDPEPTPGTSVVAQFGVVAGGIQKLQISRNRISDFQSPWDVGAIWLDPQAAQASCIISRNRLLANDDGVDVRGAQGCIIDRNVITAGAAGVEIGEGVSGSGHSFGSAPGNVVVRNLISGATTVATNVAYDGSPAIAGVPDDGVVVWSGTGNTITRNAISGFVADIYVGSDPVYLNNTATWTSPQPYAVTTGTTARLNDLTNPASPAVASGLTAYGLVNLNEFVSYALSATDNWWGCAAGPGAPGCTAATGLVNDQPWSRHPVHI